MGLVDANLLVYVLDSSDEEKHVRASSFLDSIIQNPGRFVTSNQCLREFCSVVIKKNKAPQAELEESLSTLLLSFNQIFADNQSDIQAAVGTCFANKTSFWDCLIAATMQRHGVTTIYTENEKDFKKLGLRTINPLRK